MKITKRQLKQIIREERSQVLADEIREAGRKDQLNEFDAGAFVAKAKGIMKNVTDFKAGVQKFLQDNKEWIEPVYDMVKSMKDDQDGGATSSEDADLASGSAGVVALEIGDKSPSGKGVIEDIEDNGDSVVFMLDNADIETYSKKTDALIPERYARQNRRLVESRVRLVIRRKLRKRMY